MLAVCMVTIPPCRYWRVVAQKRRDCGPMCATIDRGVGVRHLPHSSTSQQIAGKNTRHGIWPDGTHAQGLSPGSAPRQRASPSTTAWASSGVVMTMLKLRESGLIVATPSSGMRTPAQSSCTSASTTALRSGRSASCPV